MHQQAQLRLKKDEVEKLGAAAYVVLAMDRYHAKVRSVAMSANGQTLASASEDGTVKLWDMATGRPRSTLDGHTAHVYSVAFSPDGRILATGSRDTTVRLWDVTQVKDEAQELQRWRVDRERVALAFSPDGQLLAAGCRDATAKVWEVASGAERLAFGVCSVA